MVAEVGPDALTLTEVHRFHSAPVRVHGSRWDVTRHREVPGRAAGGRGRWSGRRHRHRLLGRGLRAARREVLGEPHAYRDSRTDGVAAQVLQKIDAAELYAITGVQQLPFNTIYQAWSPPRARPSEEGGDAAARPAGLLAHQ